MQPQGQVQVLANLVDFGMTFQEALEAPRVNHLEGLEVALEEGIGGEVEEDKKGIVSWTKPILVVVRERRPFPSDS